MQNWAKERRGQKQNQQMQSFQIKTRQYTNLATLGPSTNNTEKLSYSLKQTPKMQSNSQNSFNFPDFMNKVQKASFKQRYNLEDNQPSVSAFGVYNQKTNQERNDIGKISRNNNIQLEYKKYLKENNTRTKSPIKKQYVDKSFTENVNTTDTSHSQNFKKENAKKKGIQMKMTNIDSITDQISSLLNMVNKNKRISDNSGNKSKTRYGSKDNDQYKQKEGSLQNYRHRAPVTPSPSKNMPNQTNKRFINKQQRQRVYSDLDHQFRQGFHSIKYENKKQKFITCNQEDNRWNEQLKIKNNYKYSPKQHYDNQKYLQNKSFQRSTSPFQRQQTKSAYTKKQTYPQRQYQKTTSPYQQYNNKAQQMLYNDRSPKRTIQNTEVSGYKYYNKQMSDQIIEQNLPQYVPKYKKLRQNMEKKSNQMFPLSIQTAKCKEKTSNSQRPTLAFEEHLQNIKGKIFESQQKNVKNQQRFRQQEIRICNQYKPTGRLYKKNGAQNQNNFELKIYPVQVDKPNTIKIAERLADQIQFDKKLILPRVLLYQQKDQYKWSQIELSLKTKQFKMTKFQIQQMLELSSEQKNSNLHNQRGYESPKNIADLLIQAQRHWQKQVYGCASQKGLKMQNFNTDTVDSSRNGFISAEDLAHFINTYTGRKYRSKDTILIQRRLQLLEGTKNNQNVQFSTFVRALAI